MAEISNTSKPSTPAASPAASPSTGQRPSSGPGQRPSSGPGQRPSSGPGQRPSSGPGQRPASSYNRGRPQQYNRSRPGGGGGGGRPGGGDFRGRRPGGPRRRFSRRKVCRFCVGKVKYIDYKNYRLLKDFLTERGKIMPRRITGTCAGHQRMLTNAIKRSRNMALLSFTQR